MRWAPCHHNFIYVKGRTDKTKEPSSLDSVDQDESKSRTKWKEVGICWARFRGSILNEFQTLTGY